MINKWLGECAEPDLRDLSLFQLDQTPSLSGLCLFVILACYRTSHFLVSVNQLQAKDKNKKQGARKKLRFRCPIFRSSLVALYLLFLGCDNVPASPTIYYRMLLKSFFTFSMHNFKSMTNGDPLMKK
ncbi:hypothetical protein BCR42DRAFT_386857 [Absidia repens]|uniref:Uncharacterized protein n=1 Tax=Absidia repens TaxID=90262 RepID=A0A1X2IXE3_9FUNG|nr:hypothetical protein BCR42DRAFT_386857 [Absidia repens]